MGKGKLSFDFSPEWGRFLGKASECGVVGGAVKVAAVLFREDELCTVQVLGVFNHPDGEIMSLLQILDLIESILCDYGVTQICSHIWQNLEQLNETMGDTEIARGKRRS